MKQVAQMVDQKVHTFSMAKFVVSLIGLVIVVCTIISSLVTFFVDARISAARNGIVSDITPLIEQLTKQTQLMDSRLQLLEMNVVDRWTATDMSNWANELFSELRKVHPDIVRVDVYDIKRRRIGP